MFHKSSVQPISYTLKTLANLKYKMILRSLLIGLLSGITLVCYRILGEFLLEHFISLYAFVRNHPIYSVPLLGFLVLLACFVAYCVKKEPHISGSGIPQVEGVVTGHVQVNWLKVLIFKFIGGIVALAAGLSVGREGPSIQMGASIGQGFAEKTHSTDHEQRYLLTSGACAGLAAAFNAPLSGVMFALEEVHKNFSPIVLTSAMVAAVTADMLSKSILGIHPSLHFEDLPIMPLRHYWTLVLLGILSGLGSFVFNHGILWSKKLYRKSALPVQYKILLPFLFAGGIGLFFPLLIGGGHKVIMELNGLSLSLLALFGILALKYLFTFISFGSGVPGGIFFPLLAIGAISGNFFGKMILLYTGIGEEFFINFVILAMAAHFAAIVKAPITGIILIYEMTGSFEQLLPLTVIVFVALITSDLLKVEPIYELLLKDLLEHNPHTKTVQHEQDKKTLIEKTVHLGSLAEGKKISELQLPENCLIVAIHRGQSEILPKGNTRILTGDLLLIMVNQRETAEMQDYLANLTTN